MKKEKYIISMLKENIDNATERINELYNEIEEVNKLPNDCTGIMIDDVLCENKDYKIDILTNHYHVIGYMESQKALSKEILELNNMTDEEFEKYLIEQEDIRIHNEKEMLKIKNLLKK